MTKNMIIKKRMRIKGYHHSSREAIESILKIRKIYIDPKIKANLGSGFYFSKTKNETGFGKYWILIECIGNFLIIDDLRGFIILKKEVGGFHSPSQFSDNIKKKYHVDGIVVCNLRTNSFIPRIYNSGVIYNTKKIKLLNSNT